MAARGGPAGGAGAAGARRALCLLGLAHSLAAASAQAPKPLWEKDLHGWKREERRKEGKGRPKPDLAALAAKKKGSPFLNKPGAKPRKPAPPKPDLAAQAPKPLWEKDLQEWKREERRKEGKGRPKPDLAALAAKRGNPFLNKPGAKPTPGSSAPKRPPPGRKRNAPPKPGPKNTSATIVFINEAPDAKDVDIFWVKSRKSEWPPLPCKRPGHARRVMCRFGRRSGKAVQTAEELRGDLRVRGEFNITVRTDWSPLGAPHFLKLVRLGFFNGTAIFRAVRGFLAQFGVSHNARLQQKFGSATIKDDRPRPRLLPLRRGTVAFAGSGAESRASQLWVSLADELAGEQAWETPIGYIQAREGLDALDDINTEYGDLAMFNGSAPDPQMMAKEDGLNYLLKGWPNLEYFESCADQGTAEEEPPGAPQEEEELLGTVEAGKQMTHTTQRGVSFTARLRGSGEVLEKRVVRRPRELVQLSSATSSEL